MGLGEEADGDGGRVVVGDRVVDARTVGGEGRDRDGAAALELGDQVEVVAVEDRVDRRGVAVGAITRSGVQVVRRPGGRGGG